MLYINVRMYTDQRGRHNYGIEKFTVRRIKEDDAKSDGNCEFHGEVGYGVHS